MAKNSGNFGGNTAKNQEKILAYSKQIETSEQQNADYSRDISYWKVKIKETEEKINKLLENKNNLTKEEKTQLQTLEKLKKDGEKTLESVEKKYKATSDSVEKIKSKLEQLENVNTNLVDGTDEYERTLRSIGSMYGEINSVYKESEKILEQNKTEISGIISITGLLNSSNKDLVEGILRAQTGYRGITNSIVENIGTLEDSESAYKRISYEIEEQKKLIGGLASELDNIDKSDETQLEVAKELKKQLLEQADALGKMKVAAAEVSKEMQNLDFSAGQISSTMLGGWIDDLLKITKVLGITDFGSIGEAFQLIGKSDAQKTLSDLKNVKDVKIETPDQKTVENLTEVKDTQIKVPDEKTVENLTEVKDAQIKAPDQKTIENLTEVKDTQIKAPDQKTIENLTELKDAQISAQKGNPVESVITGGPIEKQQTEGIQSLGQSMQTVAKNTTPPKTKSTIARLQAMGTKQARKKEAAEGLGLDIQSEGAKVQTEQLAKVFSDAAPTIDKSDDAQSVIQAQQLSELNKNVQESEISGNKIEKKQTDVTGAAAGTAGAITTAATLGAGASMAATAATGVGIVIAAAMLAKQTAEYEDSIEAVVDKFNWINQTSQYTSAELLQQLVTLKGMSSESDALVASMRDTEEYRKMLFEYGAKAQMRERQNLESDYFNYSKGVYFDYFNYQQSLAKDDLEYRIGLERDALNFQFQQQSANLDAELERRKTLAQSAMKFIKGYATISERALNAIGSSTKAIMDAMKQFGAILEVSPKQLFRLVENAQGLAYALGTSSDQIMNVSHLFKLTSNTSEEVGQRLIQGLMKVEEQNATSIFNEMAEASADIYRLMSATPNEIYKQTAALQKAGVKLSTMLKASDTMVLNYKDSIKAEMSLGAMMGRNVSFNEARARLMAGDTAGAANAIKQQLSGVDINRLNPFEKQELTRATGIGIDQILEIVQGGEIKTDSQKRLEEAEFTGKAIAKGVLAQDIANQGAKLALEQAQRKQLLEFEQRMRLLNLRLEQKQRLEQIPIESKFRMYYDMVYGKKFAEEGMYYDIVEGLVTATRRATGGQTGLEDLEISYKQSLENMGIKQIGNTGQPGGNSIPQFITTFTPQGNGIQSQSAGGGTGGGPGGGTGVGQVTFGQPQIEVLGKTVVELDDKLNSLGITSTDSRYIDWLMESGDIGTKFKKGKIDALKAEQQYRESFNKIFSQEINAMNELIKKEAEKEQLLKTKLNIDADIKSISDELEDFSFFGDKDQEIILNTVKKFKTQEEFEFFIKTFKEKTGRDFGKVIEEEFSNNLATEYWDLQGYLKNVGYDLKTVGQPKGGRFTTGGKPSFYKKENMITSPNGTMSPTTPNNTFIEGPVGNGWSPYGMGSLQGPGGSFLPGKTSDGTGFLQGPGGNGTYTPPGGQLITTGFNAYTPPTTTPPPGGDTISNEKDITNQIEVVKVLNKIQSEAHSRGITMHTAQNTATTYIKSSAEKLHYAKVAVEGTKMDSTKLVEKGIPSTQNLEQISIEMIKELQVANELLAGVFNNTQPAEGGIVLNLDGKKLATNFQNRMNNRQAFNNANRTRTNP